MPYLHFCHPTTVASGIMKINHRDTEAQRKAQRMNGLHASGAQRAFLCATSVSLCLCGEIFQQHFITATVCNRGTSRSFASLRTTGKRLDP